MTMHYAIMSADDNPLYLDFWPIVAEVWLKRFAVVPVLFHIDQSLSASSSESGFVPDRFGLVRRMPPAPGTSVGLQTQLIRLWAASLFQEAVAIITDIDMMPIDREYFLDPARSCSDGSLIVYSADAPCPPDQYPMCYVAGEGRAFRSVFAPLLRPEVEGKCTEWLEFLQRAVMVHGADWHTDQRVLRAGVDSWPGPKVMLSRGWWAGLANRRIDRLCWQYDTDKVRTSVDAHLLRPYATYSETIERLKTFVLSAE